MTDADGGSGASRYLGAKPAAESLLVNEIYPSLQGEGPETGYPTTLVRLTGCNLRCRYCDSTFAYFKGERMSLEAVCSRVESYGISRVLVTGGEPMAQAATPALCRALLLGGHRVSIETSGAFSLKALPPEVTKVVDVKTPGSGEADSFQTDILGDLTPKDALKFVLRGREDYLFALDFLERTPGALTPQVFLSPVWGELDPKDLADWMLKDRPEARLMVQLHKVLWGDQRGR
ncbi:MAG: radical SAM protein [Acidobacteriota bacterium]